MTTSLTWLPHGTKGYKARVPQNAEKTVVLFWNGFGAILSLIGCLNWFGRDYECTWRFWDRKCCVFKGIHLNISCFSRISHLKRYVVLNKMYSFTCKLSLTSFVVQIFSKNHLNCLHQDSTVYNNVDFQHFTKSSLTSCLPTCLLDVVCVYWHGLAAAKRQSRLDTNLWQSALDGHF